MIRIFVSRRLMRSIASAARAASPPLLSLAGARPRPGLRLGIDGDDAVAERKLSRHRQVHQRARGSRSRRSRNGWCRRGPRSRARSRRHRVCRSFGGIDRNRDRRRNFQRAGHGDDVVADAGGLQFGDRAFQQRILDVVVEPRLDDQRARARDVGLVLQRCAPRVCHMFVHPISALIDGDLERPTDRIFAYGRDGYASSP